MAAHPELDIRVGKETDRHEWLEVATDSHFLDIKFPRAAIAALIRWRLHKRYLLEMPIARRSACALIDSGRRAAG